MCNFWVGVKEREDSMQYNTFTFAYLHFVTLLCEGEGIFLSYCFLFILTKSFPF